MLIGTLSSWCCLLHTGLDLPCWEESDCRRVVCCILDWTYPAERKVVGVVLVAAYWIGRTMLRGKWLLWCCLLHTGWDLPCWEESDCRRVVCCILDWTYHAERKVSCWRGVGCCILDWTYNAERKVIVVVLFVAYGIGFTMLRGKWLLWCCLLHTGLDLPCWVVVRKVVGVVLFVAYWIGLTMLRGKWLSWCCLLHTGLDLPCWEERCRRGVVCCILDWTYHAERKVVGVVLFAAYWIGLTMLRGKWLAWCCLLHTGLDLPCWEESGRRGVVCCTLDWTYICWEESDCHGVVCCILDWTYHAERKVVVMVLFAAYWIGLTMLRGKWLAWCCLLHTGLNLPCWEESDYRGVVCCLLDWTYHAERKVVGVVLFAAYWIGLTMLRGKWLAWCCLLHTGLDLPCWEESDCRRVVCCILDWTYQAERKVGCRGVVCCILDWTYHAERKVIVVVLFAAYWIGRTMLRGKWLAWCWLLHTGFDLPCWEESYWRCGVVCCILDWTYHAERKGTHALVVVVLCVEHALNEAVTETERGSCETVEDIRSHFSVVSLTRECVIGEIGARGSSYRSGTYFFSVTRNITQTHLNISIIPLYPLLCYTRVFDYYTKSTDVTIHRPTY